MSNKMWGGRFASGPGAIMEEINASIDFDKALYRQDIAASKAHADMLAKQGIITADDAKKIAHGLDTILSEIAAGKFSFKRALEDIHMNVEGRLAELIGEAAGRLHTARSRNDQVATDFRLWMRDTIDALDAALAAFQRALAEKALAHAGTVMPQKRNPDAAELVRAKAGRVIGALNALLIVMKGLPLAYAKDMQEDKEGAMDALAALALSLSAMAGMVTDLEPDTARMKKAAGEGYATATDLADWLV